MLLHLNRLNEKYTHSSWWAQKNFFLRLYWFIAYPFHLLWTNHTITCVHCCAFARLFFYYPHCWINDHSHIMCIRLCFSLLGIIASNKRNKNKNKSKKAPAPNQQLQSDSVEKQAFYTRRIARVKAEANECLVKFEKWLSKMETNVWTDHRMRAMKKSGPFMWTSMKIIFGRYLILFLLVFQIHNVCI